jgi:hypothetical protein
MLEWEEDFPTRPWFLLPRFRAVKLIRGVFFVVVVF